jgi:hypothetical protein
MITRFELVFTVFAPPIMPGVKTIIRDEAVIRRAFSQFGVC